MKSLVGVGDVDTLSFRVIESVHNGTIILFFVKKYNCIEVSMKLKTKRDEEVCDFLQILSNQIYHTKFFLKQSSYVVSFFRHF